MAGMEMLIIWKITIEKSQGVVRLMVSNPQLANKSEESSCIRIVGSQNAKEVQVTLAEIHPSGLRCIILP